MKFQDYAVFGTGMNSMNAIYGATRKDAGVRKRHRTHFTAKQVEKLEEVYKQTANPYRELIVQLSSILNLTDKNISIWFKNRRAKTRRQQKTNTDKSEEKVVVTGQETQALEDKVPETVWHAQNETGYEPTNQLQERVTPVPVPAAQYPTTTQHNYPNYSSYYPYSYPTYSQSTPQNYGGYNSYQELSAFSKYPTQGYTTDFYSTYPSTTAHTFNYNTSGYANFSTGITANATSYSNPQNEGSPEFTVTPTPPVTSSTKLNDSTFQPAPTSPVSDNSASDIFSSSFSSLSSLL